MPPHGLIARDLSHPLAWAVLGMLALSALFFDAFPYDVLAYHGPFAAVATGLSRLSDYSMSAFMLQRYEGFPPLWRWLLAPGLALGQPRLLGLPNLLALLVVAWSAWRTLRLPWWLSMGACLLFPIALFGFRTPYQDFFVGALMTAATLLIIESLWQWGTSGQGARTAWLALPPLLAIGLTKYQGLFQAVLVLALALLAALALGWRQRRPASALRAGPLPALLLALLLCGLHPLHNLLSHNNPAYPIAAGPFPGPEVKASNESPAYTAGLGPLQTFANHWLSASELDWIARGVVPSYNLDQARAQTQYGGLIDPRAEQGVVRSGGSFGPAYLATMAAWGAAFSQALGQWRRERRPSARGWAVLAIAPLLLLGAGFPQSHELRYYLALMQLPALTALGWWWVHGSRRWLEAGVLALLGVAIVLNFAQPLHSTLKDLRRGEGFSYALGYPSRDLPTAEECLRLGRQVLGQAEPTIELPTGQAFACRLRLPAPLRVREKAS
ncbi:MAG: hypothetical protein VKO44_11290 [Cyanobacteriota bacterium]|nr:hypothetical protein [Cyanobacteriota bacterium]